VISVKGKAKSSSICAVVNRADGTVQNLGMIAYWHKNPVICWLVNRYIKIKERLRA
jgi:hypothetical protein